MALANQIPGIPDRPKSGIEMEIDRLNDAVNHSNELSKQLMDRLTPVLRAATPENSQACEEQVTSSDLGGCLRALSEDIRRNNNMLMSMSERIDL
jgi:hypothetical protein